MSATLDRRTKSFKLLAKHATIVECGAPEDMAGAERWVLERVAKGERIVITNRGKPVAMLVPPEVGGRADAAEIGRAMLTYRDEVKRRLGSSFRDLAHEVQLGEEVSGLLEGGELGLILALECESRHREGSSAGNGSPLPKPLAKI